MFVTIAPEQTDAKSPLDEDLMDTIRQDLDDLDNRANQVGIFDYQWKINGYLDNLPTRKYRRLDGALVSKDSTLQKCQLWLAEPGTGGTLEVDVRKYTKPDVAITNLQRLFNVSLNSIARAGAGNSTQSVTRATAQISTQSVALWKAALNIQSIVLMGTTDLGQNLVRINLSGTVDSGWQIGDTVTIASAVSGVNNGSFLIVAKNMDGGNNVIIQNASGVPQASTTGTCTLRAYLYTFTNPVSSQFAAGEKALFASHTSANNDGSLTIYAVNQSGNNIVVKNPNGVAQASAAGTADTLRWIFAFSSSAPSDYVVGEKAYTHGHTSGNNDGKLYIRAVNSGGNNVILYNESGVVQGGAAGTVDTLRWVYFFSVDPSTDITAGDSVLPSSTTDSNNSGEFVVKQVNRSTSDNIVLYNENGVAQGGAAGLVVSKKMLIKFATDQSSYLTTDSRIVIYGTAYYQTDGDYDVLQVNRGGGSNYNCVIETSVGLDSYGALGRVVAESKSVFDTRPKIIIPPVTSGFAATHFQLDTSSVLNATRKIIDAGTLLMVDIVSIPSGKPKNVVIQLL